jgi:hypothetical protein
MPPEETKPPLSPASLPRRHPAGPLNPEKARQPGKAPRKFTPARRAASLRNLERARAALRARPRKLSPAQLAAARRTIALARAARTPEGQLRQAQKVLKHGLFALRLRGPQATLGENSRDYEALERLVRRYLDPQNPREEKLARRMAEALWRHQRLYFAQASWELERLRKFLTEAPPSRESSAEFTFLRVYALFEVLLDRSQSAAYAWSLLGSTERLLRRFIRLRAGRKSEFRMGPRVIANHGYDRAGHELEKLITDPDARADLIEYELASLG